MKIKLLVLLSILLFSSCLNQPANVDKQVKNDGGEEPFRYNCLAELLNHCEGHAILVDKWFDGNNFESKDSYHLILDSAYTSRIYLGGSFINYEKGDTIIKKY